MAVIVPDIDLRMLGSRNSKSGSDVVIMYGLLFAGIILLSGSLASNRLRSGNESVMMNCLLFREFLKSCVSLSPDETSDSSAELFCMATFAPSRSAGRGVQISV